MHAYTRYLLYLIPVGGLLLVSGCGGGGSSSSGNVTPAAAVTTSADIINSKGTPAMFSIECGRLAYDQTTASWIPQDGFVRVETWIYSGASGAEVVAITNGEVINETQTADDYSQYPAPSIDPRRFGCGEPIATVERVLGGTPLLTTEGSATEADLNLGTTQLKAVYYTINSATSGIQVTYSNDQLVGMVTL